MKTRHQGAAGPGRRRRKKQRPDITVTKSGKITITGPTLEKLQRMADEAGMTVKEFFMGRLREEMQGLLENIVQEQIRECHRLLSWCDRNPLKGLAKLPNLKAKGGKARKRGDWLAGVSSRRIFYV